MVNICPTCLLVCKNNSSGTAGSHRGDLNDMTTVLPVATKPRVGFEPTILMFEPYKTVYALNLKPPARLILSLSLCARRSKFRAKYGDSMFHRNLLYLPVSLDGVTTQKNVRQHPHRLEDLRSHISVCLSYVKLTKIYVVTCAVVTFVAFLNRCVAT